MGGPRHRQFQGRVRRPRRHHAGGRRGTGNSCRRRRTGDQQRHKLDRPGPGTRTRRRAEQRIFRVAHIRMRTNDSRMPRLRFQPQRGVNMPVQRLASRLWRLFGLKFKNRPRSRWAPVSNTPPRIRDGVAPSGLGSGVALSPRAALPLVACPGLFYGCPVGAEPQRRNIKTCDQASIVATPL